MRTLSAVLMAGLLAVGAVPARAEHGTPGEEAGYALGAATLNIFYVPAKLLTALTGLVTGGFVAVFTGGSQRAAYAIWVPTSTGTFFLRPSHIAGTTPIEFLGSEYQDTPSENSVANDSSRIYQSLYQK